MKFANFLILPLIFLFTYCSSDSNDDNQIDDNSSSSVSEVRDSTEDSFQIHKKLPNQLQIIIQMLLRKGP